MLGLPQQMQVRRHLLRRRQLMQLRHGAAVGAAATVLPFLPLSWPLVRLQASRAERTAVAAVVSAVAAAAVTSVVAEDARNSRWLLGMVCTSQLLQLRGPAPVADECNHVREQCDPVQWEPPLGCAPALGQLMQLLPRPLLHMLTRPLMKLCPSQLMHLLGLWRLRRGRAPPLERLESPRLGQLMQLLARPLLQLLSRPLMQLCPSRMVQLRWPSPCV